MNFTQALKDFGKTATGVFSNEGIRRVAIAIAVGILLLAILRALRGLVARGLRRHAQLRTAAVTEKAFHYFGLGAVLFIALDIAGMDVRALLGAAGIVGIAVGFAAQTSISNVISGIFLVSEKAFGPGDVIRVGDEVGTVISVDILSVKMRTFENQLVRLPNETMVKSVIVNLTRYPIRRINAELQIAHGDDLEEVKKALMEAAAGLPEVLREPEPFFLIDGYGPEGIKVIFGLWIRQEDLVLVKNGIYMAIQKAFAERGFRAPYARLRVFLDKDTANQESRG